MPVTCRHYKHSYRKSQFVKGWKNAPEQKCEKTDNNAQFIQVYNLYNTCKK